MNTRKIIVIAIVAVLGISLLAGGAIAGLNNAKYKKLERKCKKAMSKGAWDVARDTFDEIASDDSLRAAKFLMKLAKNLGVPLDAFKSIKEALKKFKDPEAVAYLCKQADKGRWELKAMLSEVFGEMSDDASLDALHEILASSKQMVVLREAVLAVAKRKDLDSVTPLIDVLARTEKRKGVVWTEVRKALIKITDEDYECAADWRTFWDGSGRKMVEKSLAEKEKKKDPKDPKDPTTPGKDTPGKTFKTSGKPNPKFFGTEVCSKRFVFIIDRSGSMLRDISNPEKMPSSETPKSRIAIVKKELIKVIKSIDPGASFNIISYASEVTRWNKKGLVRANRRSKAAAIKYVQAMKAVGTTHTDKAIRAAFANKAADTIFLLSDGAPTHTGQCKDTPQIVAEIFDFVGKANRFRKVKIFTFGFKSSGGSSFEFLKKLAEDNGGKIKAVD